MNCKNCSIDREENEYTISGLKNKICKSCKKEYDKQYFLKNRDEILNRNKNYLDKNLELQKEYRKNYYMKNKEQIIDKNKKYLKVKKEYDKKYRELKKKNSKK